MESVKEETSKELEALKEAQEIAKEEIKTFVLNEYELETIHGTKIKLNKCSWGKEMQVMAALKEVLHDVAVSGILGSADLTQGEAVMRLLSSIFGQVPQSLTKIVAALAEQDEQWVCENLESDEMLRLVIPFLYTKSQKLGGVLSQYQEQLRGAAQRILN